ncbi:hypothetical protein [Chryseobacterium culicis]|uniref:hypothetical protein n=1 Tax=Chryseobacterium culicis TaxID=680127 RepID=UPI0028A0794F|nr:hypothetical protein [Chryseobacterium culicis]
MELKYFNTNITKVLEAINHNSCLYKKIGIDKNGNIKNCPLMKENFGNIDKTRSKPLKFGYNPYTGEWKDWSKNPLKKKIFNSLESK